MDFRIPILLLVSLNLIKAEDSSLESNDSSIILPTPNPNIVTIDLRQCFCSVKEACELTIIKSSLREANCNDGEHLCCPMIKSRAGSQLDESLDSDTEPQTPNNVRVYSIYPASIPSTSTNELTEPKSKTKKNCSCKSRGTCPHKYIDYGFGFHCSYSTVRCCVPEEDLLLETSEKAPAMEKSNTTVEALVPPSQDLESLQKNTSDVNEPEKLEAFEMESAIQTDGVALEDTSNGDVAISEDLNMNGFKNATVEPEGELLITEVTNWNDDDLSYERDSQCFCLSVEKCMATMKYDLNSIERRRDTLCPGDLIQCCGKDVAEEITKKKDDNNDLEVTHINQDFPPYQQPIQLPGSQPTNPSIAENNNLNLAPEKEATLPPPQLPTQYHTYDPVTYNRGNVYAPNTYPTQLSGPPSYQKNMYGQNGQVNGQNIRPWVNLASPSSYSKYNPNALRNQYHQGHPRGPYPDNGSSRSNKPGGLFDTLAQMLG